MQEQLMLFLLLLLLIVAVYNSNCLPQNIFQVDAFRNSPPGECKCVPYYNCRDGEISRHGAGVLKERAGNRMTTCEGVLDVCCKVLKDKEEKEKIQITTPKVRKLEKLPQQQPNRGCGYRKEGAIRTRLVNFSNETTEFGEFPWMIGILEFNAGSLVYKCGGSLILPQVVLTAAHCFQNGNAQNIYARAGEFDSQRTDEPIPHQDIKVRTVVKHEKFVPSTLHNDIALLLLESPFKLADNVGTICLPKNAMDISQRKDCLATGWGREFNNDMAPYHTVLRKVDLPMVPAQECQRRLRTTRLGNYFKLHASFVCAGGEKNKDTCSGDGGSPLVCPIPNQRGRYFQTGIVAGGIDCGAENPGLYVNVAYFKDWINSNVVKFRSQKAI